MTELPCVGKPTSRQAACNPQARAALRKKADDHAAAVRPIIDAMRAEGITGLKRIAAALNERSIRTASRKRWYRPRWRTSFGGVGRPKIVRTGTIFPNAAS